MEATVVIPALGKYDGRSLRILRLRSQPVYQINELWVSKIKRRIGEMVQ